MKISSTTISLLLILFVLGAIWLVGSKDTPPNPTFGSIAQNEAYYSTTTTSKTGVAIANYALLKNGPGLLGSVVIANAGSAQMLLYDATTSNPSLRTNTATTVLASIGAGATQNTYVYDSTFNYGLIVEYLTSNPGTSTITWK